MKTECGMIKDLLPLYIEKLTSEASNKVVEEHFEECEQCRIFFEKMSLPNPKIQYNRKPAESFRNYVKNEQIKLVFKVALITAIVSIIIFVGICIWLFGLPPKKITGIENYYETMQKYAGDKKTYQIRSGFLCFPDDLPGSTDPVQSQFFFSNQDSLLGSSTIVYLECVYDDKDFAAEIDRLEHAERMRPVRRDDGSRFAYPAYYAIYDDYAGKDEYALITGENRIAYIARLETDFSEEIPENYRPFSDKAAEERYNAYHAEPEEGQIGYEVDYALVPDTTSHSYYYEKTGENTFFLLRTERDEAGVERIARCMEGIIETSNHSIRETEIRELSYLNGVKFLELQVEPNCVTISCERADGAVDVKWAY